MTRTPVVVVVAAIIAGTLVAQGILEYVFSLGLVYAAPADGATNDFLSAFPRVVADTVIEVVFYAIGWFLSIRFISRLSASDSWKRTVGRGLIASVAGVVVLTIGLTVVGFLGSIGPGPHPFGYAFDLTINAGPLSNWAYLTAQDALRPLVEWFPLSVLACVFLKLWLAAHPEPVETTDRVSVSATP